MPHRVSRLSNPQVPTQWAIILFVTVGQKLKPHVLVQVPREKDKAQNQTMGQEKDLNQVVAATLSTKDPGPTTLVNLDTGACSTGGPIHKLTVPWGKDKGHFNLYSLAKRPIKYDNLIRMLGRPFIFVVLSLIVNARGEESCRPAIICCEESLRRCGGGCDCILFSRRMTRERVLQVQFAPSGHLVYADRVLVEAVGDPVPRISK